MWEPMEYHVGRSWLHCRSRLHCKKPWRCDDASHASSVEHMFAQAGFIIAQEQTDQACTKHDDHHSLTNSCAPSVSVSLILQGLVGYLVDFLCFTWILICFCFFFCWLIYLFGCPLAGVLRYQGQPRVLFQVSGRSTRIITRKKSKRNVRQSTPAELPVATHRRQHTPLLKYRPQVEEGRVEDGH